MSGKRARLRAYDETVEVLGRCTHNDDRAAGDTFYAPADWRVRRSNGDELCVRNVDLEFPKNPTGAESDR